MLSKSCSEAGTEYDVPSLAEFVNTPSVVYDMVEILERLGEAREKEAKRLLDTASMSSEKSAEVLTRTAWQKGQEKLQYWGFSYVSHTTKTFIFINALTTQGYCTWSNFRGNGT